MKETPDSTWSPAKGALWRGATGTTHGVANEERGGARWRVERGIHGGTAGVKQLSFSGVGKKTLGCRDTLRCQCHSTEVQTASHMLCTGRTHAMECHQGGRRLRGIHWDALSQSSRKAPWNENEPSMTGLIFNLEGIVVQSQGSKPQMCSENMQRKVAPEEFVRKTINPSQSGRTSRTS